MPKASYRWRKTYVVETDMEDDVEVGNEIEVDSQGGGSTQRVLSVTVKKNQSGKEYKVLLVEEVK